MGFSDLTPDNSILGATDNTKIGNDGDKLKTTAVGLTPGIAIATGEITGWTGIHKFGQNKDIDTGTIPEDIWSVGGLYPFPTSALTTTVASSNTNDTSAGTGVRTIKVMGLNSSFVEIEETVTMNGTTNVTLANSYLRITRAFVETVGSNGTNLGDVDVKHTAVVLARIPIGIGQTEMAIFTIPAGKTGFIVDWGFRVQKSTGVAGSIDAKGALLTREDGFGFRTRANAIVQSDGDQSPVAFAYPVVVNEKTDIVARITEVGANNTETISHFDIFLKDNA